LPDIKLIKDYSPKCQKKNSCGEENAIENGHKNRHFMEEAIFMTNL
jgi:hypothetical protein